MLFFQALQRNFCFSFGSSCFLFTFSNVQIQICKFAQNKCNFLCLSFFVFVFVFARFGFIFYVYFCRGICLARFNLLQLFSAIRLLLWIVKANRHEIVFFAFRLFFQQSLFRHRLTSTLNGSYSTFLLLALLPLFYAFSDLAPLSNFKAAWQLLGGEREGRNCVLTFSWLGNKKHYVIKTSRTPLGEVLILLQTH